MIHPKYNLIDVRYDIHNNTNNATDNIVSFATQDKIEFKTAHQLPSIRLILINNCLDILSS